MSRLSTTPNRAQQQFWPRPELCTLHRKGQIYPRRCVIGNGRAFEASWGTPQTVQNQRQGYCGFCFPGGRGFILPQQENTRCKVGVGCVTWVEGPVDTMTSYGVFCRTIGAVLPSEVSRAMVSSILRRNATLIFIEE